jgi:2-(1,2-epoxy-1,2-dihydrophenyl)acetyl-CoA isomerase
VLTTPIACRNRTLKKRSTMSSFETITLQLEQGLATLTLNRPDQANAMNPLMAKELSDAATRLAEQSDLRCVLIRSTGKLFCAGGDIAEFAEAGQEVGRLIRTMAGDLHIAISRLTRLDAPVVCAVQGTAAGAGLSLCVAADLAIAVDTAKFTSAYTKAGLSPDGSSTYFLPRRIGDRKARELMLTNRVLSAEEAVSWGLINQAVPAESFESAVAQCVGEVMSGPTRAFGSVKRLLNESSHTSLETQMELETREIASCAVGEDGQEGIQAFLAKRAPNFKGR